MKQNVNIYFETRKIQQEEEWDEIEFFLLKKKNMRNSFMRLAISCFISWERKKIFLRTSFEAHI